MRAKSTSMQKATHLFDKKKEETAAPEPSDLAAGIPSVAGKRSTGSKQSAFLLFAACVVVGFIGIAAVNNQVGFKRQ